MAAFDRSRRRMPYVTFFLYPCSFHFLAIASEMRLRCDGLSAEAPPRSPPLESVLGNMPITLRASARVQVARASGVWRVALPMPARAGEHGACAPRRRSASSLALKRETHCFSFFLYIASRIARARAARCASRAADTRLRSASLARAAAAMASLCLASFSFTSGLSIAIADAFRIFATIAGDHRRPLFHELLPFSFSLIFFLRALSPSSSTSSSRSTSGADAEAPDDARNAKPVASSVQAVCPPSESVGNGRRWC